MTRSKKSLFHRMASVFCVILMVTLSLGGLTTPAKAYPTGTGTTTRPMSVSRTSLYFGSGVSSAKVTVSNVSSYSVSTDYGSWINWSKSGSTVTISVRANATTSNRYGNVKIKSGGQTISISITQYCPIVVMSGSNYQTKVNSVTLQGVVNKIGSPSIIVKVNAAGTIRATSSSSWISTSVNGKYITITAKPNTERDMRRGAITISNGYDTFTLSVIQQKIVLDDICSYYYFDSTYISPTGRIVNAYQPMANANTWRSYSRDQQSSYLIDFGSAVKSWLGVSYTLPIYYMTRDKADIEFGLGTLGLPGNERYSSVGYDASGRPQVIVLNYNLLYTDPTIAVQAVIHEYRHAYQLQTGRYGGTMMQLLFKYNFEHYISEFQDPTRYENQFVELDARTYARYLLEGLQRAVR